MGLPRLGTTKDTKLSENRHRAWKLAGRSTPVPGRPVGLRNVLKEEAAFLLLCSFKSRWAQAPSRSHRGHLGERRKARQCVVGRRTGLCNELCGPVTSVGAPPAAQGGGDRPEGHLSPLACFRHLTLYPAHPEPCRGQRPCFPNERKTGREHPTPTPGPTPAPPPSHPSQAPRPLGSRVKPVRLSAQG